MAIQVNVLCKMGPVLSASTLHWKRRMYICSPLFMEERRTYICSPFCGTANEQDHCLILWRVRSLYYTGLLQDFLYPQPRNRKKCYHNNTCCQILLKSQPAPIDAGVLNAKNPQKYKSKKQKKCCHGNTCCQVLSKN